MPWYKLKDKEPFNKDDEYFLRNGGDKETGWWDNEAKEFYTIERDAGMAYFENHEFPNIEWWEEREENRDEDWDQVALQLNDLNLGGVGRRKAVIDWLKDKFTLIRK